MNQGKAKFETHMGITTITAELRPITNGKRALSIDFLVDSGALLTVVPEKYWQKLGLTQTDEQSFSLTDGTIIKRKVAFAIIRYKSFEAPIKVVLGEADDSALMGSTALENMGLVLDPLKRRLRQARMML